MENLKILKTLQKHMQKESESGKRYAILKHLSDRSVYDIESWGFKIARNGKAYLISW